MSEFKVPLTTIKTISAHPNPAVERLEIATVYDFQVVVRKNQYSVGDVVAYIPIDSVLPRKLEEQLFPEGSKIKLHKSRVKQIRIQKFPSQGMLLGTGDIIGFTTISKLPPIETNIADILGITKYEPPAPSFSGPRSTNPRNKPLENPLFHKYNGIENVKWYPDLFSETEEVVIQEKLHGSNVRCGYLPTSANTLWKKVLKFFKLLPNYEYTYGSNNVELTNRRGYTGYYGEDVYGSVLRKVRAFDKIEKNEIIYGELIGPSIQKGYDYGHTEHHFVLFDVKVLQADGTYKWLNPEEVQEYAETRGFDMVPTLYVGPYNKALAHELTKGASVYCPKQKVREGIVIKSRLDYNCVTMPSQKKVLKWISEAYLDGDQSDFH